MLVKKALVSIFFCFIKIPTLLSLGFFYSGDCSPLVLFGLFQVSRRLRSLLGKTIWWCKSSQRKFFFYVTNPNKCRICFREILFFINEDYSLTLYLRQGIGKDMHWRHNQYLFNNSLYRCQKQMCLWPRFGFLQSPDLLFHAALIMLILHVRSEVIHRQIFSFGPKVDGLWIL
jgi:hypothetical protein